MSAIALRYPTNITTHTLSNPFPHTQLFSSQHPQPHKWHGMYVDFVKGWRSRLEFELEQKAVAAAIAATHRRNSTIKIADPDSISVLQYWLEQEKESRRVLPPPPPQTSASSAREMERAALPSIEKRTHVARIGYWKR